MKLVLKTIGMALCCLSIYTAKAQDVPLTEVNRQKIEVLEQQKISIETEERNLLRNEVENIDEQVKNSAITKKEGEQLKLEAAKKRAANIDNKTAIIENQIELIKRGELPLNHTEKLEKATAKENTREPNVTVYNPRTYTGIVFAIGFNNALIENENLDDSPYKIGGSGFVEMGIVFNTQLIRNSNFLTLKYGASVQWNKFNIKDNQYFVEDQNNIVTLQEHSDALKEAKFRVTNLVAPVHLEFGSSQKTITRNGVNYFRGGSFKLGLGGYGGIRLHTLQKLKFNEANDDHGKKQKIKDDYNTSNFVYGLSAYIGVNQFSLYAKYDLSPVFKHQPTEQRNISLGLRFDLD